MHRLPIGSQRNLWSLSGCLDLFPAGQFKRGNRCDSQKTKMLKRYKLDDFTKGWFVGNFSPTLLATDAVEVAVKHYRAGEAESAHYHKVATELTLIVSGRVRMSGEEFGAGEIIKIEPGQATDFVPLTDTITVVVKLPCVSGDKYLSD